MIKSRFCQSNRWNHFKKWKWHSRVYTYIWVPTTLRCTSWYIHSYFYIRFIRQLGRVVLSFQLACRLRFCYSLWRRTIRNLLLLLFFFFLSKPFMWYTGIFRGWLLYTMYSIVSGVMMRARANNINVRFMCVSVPMSNNQNQQDDSSIVENQKLSTQVTSILYITFIHKNISLFFWQYIYQHFW